MPASKTLGKYAASILMGYLPQKPVARSELRTSSYAYGHVQKQKMAVSVKETDRPMTKVCWRAWRFHVSEKGDMGTLVQSPAFLGWKRLHLRLKLPTGHEYLRRHLSEKLSSSLCRTAPRKV